MNIQEQHIYVIESKEALAKIDKATNKDSQETSVTWGFFAIEDMIKKEVI